MSISAKFTVAAAIALIASPALATDFTITGSSVSGPFTYLHILTGDLDGDGGNDDGVLRLACSSGAVSSAWIYAPRDTASGQASGKRMHKPFTVVKEWGAASPQLSIWKGGYDLKASKKGYDYYRTQNMGRVAKTMAMDDWSEITVTKLDAACSPGGGMPVVK